MRTRLRASWQYGRRVELRLPHAGWPPTTMTSTTAIAEFEPGVQHWQTNAGGSHGDVHHATEVHGARP
jgi:hypothetical protein